MTVRGRQKRKLSHAGAAGRRSGSGRSAFRAQASGRGRNSAPSAMPAPGKKARQSTWKLRDKPQAIDWIFDVFKYVLVIIVILYCVSVSGKAFDAGYSIFYEEAVDAEGEGVSMEVTITGDMSVAQIGAMLEEMGLLRDGSVFQYQELFSSSHGQITAGTYTLSTDMTPSEIVRALAENYVEDEED